MGLAEYIYLTLGVFEGQYQQQYTVNIGELLDTARG